MEQLQPQQQQIQFKREHLEDVSKLKTDEGIWLDVLTNFTVGIKA